MLTLPLPASSGLQLPQHSALGWHRMLIMVLLLPLLAPLLCLLSSLRSIEYWPDPQRGICESYRVLKPGGVRASSGPCTRPSGSRAGSRTSGCSSPLRRSTSSGSQPPASPTSSSSASGPSGTAGTAGTGSSWAAPSQVSRLRLGLPLSRYELLFVYLSLLKAAVKALGSSCISFFVLSQALLMLLQGMRGARGKLLALLTVLLHPFAR